jgi:hypothetical protein
VTSHFPFLRGDRIVRQHVENQVNEVARWGSFEEIRTALGREKEDAALAATVRIPSVEARKDRQAFDLPRLVSGRSASQSLKDTHPLESPFGPSMYGCASSPVRPKMSPSPTG